MTDTTDQLASHEARLQRLEQEMTIVRIATSRLEQDMLTNTALTKQTRDNTSEIVSLLKGGVALGKFAKWAAAIALLVGLILELGRRLKDLA